MPQMQHAAPQMAQPPAGMNMDMPSPEPAAQSMEEMPTFSKAQPEPKALPEADVMNLTVKELIERCQKINPLVCMGLEQFIDMNKDELLSMTTGESKPEENPMDDTDLTFSKQMEPQPAEFSLDQPASDLAFPS
jgi:hypothetical protein